MKLHENQSDFAELIALTGQDFGIEQVLVEKDYWVTLALYNLSKTIYSKKVVFKGGTSLSKAHKLIKRFSEDIDLAVLVETGTSGADITKLLKEVEKACTTGFKVVANDPRTSKKGRFRKTVWEFEKIGLEKNYGDAGEHILVEVNSFTTPEPHNDMPISSLIADYLIKTDQHEVIKEFSLEAFNFSVLRPERTFVEKISALTKCSYTSDDNFNLLSKNIRHFYDITKLMGNCGDIVLKDKANFLDLFQRVKADDKILDSKNEWAHKLYKEAAIFSDFDNVWKKIGPAYKGPFKNMLYGDEQLPEDAQVKEAIKAISSALNEYE